jgi:hypothetical protein
VSGSVIDCIREAERALDYAATALEAPELASIRDTLEELGEARVRVHVMIAMVEQIAALDGPGKLIAEQILDMVKGNTMSERYNGWTNYATWRVRLEMFDYDGASDNDLDAYDLADSLRESALSWMDEQASGLALDYARAFLDDVNWREIAASMIEAYREEEADA